MLAIWHAMQPPRDDGPPLPGSDGRRPKTIGEQRDEYLREHPEMVGFKGTLEVDG